MARGRGGFGGGRRPVALTGTITGGERDDLANLLSGITEIIALNMMGIFLDPNAPPRPTTRGSITDASHKENLPPRLIHGSRNSVSSFSGSFSTSTSAGAATSEDEDPAILKELRKEMLSFFRKWQVALVNRTRDLEAADPPHTPEEFEPPTGRRGRVRGGRNNARPTPRPPQPKIVPVGSRTVDTGTSPVRPPTMQQTDPNLRRFQPVTTPLWHLPVERRRLLQNIAFLMVLSIEDYSAYGRTVMMYLASSLNLPMRSVQEDEVRIGRCLGKISLDFALGEMARRIEEGAEMPRGRQTGPNRANDTGFLAGPISQSTLGRCMDGAVLGGTTTIELLGQLGDNGVAMGSLFAFYGAKATGKTMDAYAKDVQDFALLPIHGKLNKNEPLMDTRDLHHLDRRLRMVICINGSMIDESDQVHDPWQSLGNQAEVYALRWETNSLRSLGSCMEMVADSRGWMDAKKHFKDHSIHDAFVKSQWPTSLERLSKILDNPWTVGMVRADKVGLVLADTIQRKVQGGRPISLVGYGLGARSIYTCLMALAERRQFGLIESVLMMGCPAPSTNHVWVTMKSIVNGRLINAYSPSDYLMPFMYRLSDPQFGLAGIQPVLGCPGVENYDVGDLAIGYMRYQFMTGKIMQQVSWEDVDHETVAKEAVKLFELDQKYAPESIIPKPDPVPAGKIKGKPPTAAAAVAAAVLTASSQGPLRPVRPSALNERRGPVNGRNGNGPAVPLSITTSGPMFPPTPRPSRETIGSSRNRSNSSVSNNSRSSYMTSGSSVPLASSGGSTGTTRSVWSTKSGTGGELAEATHSQLNRRNGNRDCSRQEDFEERVGGSGGVAGGRGKRGGGGGRRDRADSHDHRVQDSRGQGRWAEPMFGDLRGQGHVQANGNGRNGAGRQNGGGRFGAIGDSKDDTGAWGKASGGRRRRNGGGGGNSTPMNSHGGGSREGTERFDDDFGKERRPGRRGQRGSGNGGGSRAVPNQN